MNLLTIQKRLRFREVVFTNGGNRVIICLISNVIYMRMVKFVIQLAGGQ